MERSWLWPLGMVLGLWVVAIVSCLPALASTRIRDRLKGWPTDRLGANYAGLLVVFVVGQVTLYLGRAFLQGPISGTPLLRWTALVAVGYPVAVWLLIVVAGSATGAWSRSAAGIDGRLVLGGVTVVYVVATGGLIALVVFLLFVAYFPG